MTSLQRIREIFEARGNEKYADEDVTQLEHALQCAELARKQGESDAMVVAALLHDIGHILGDADLPQDCQDNLDDAHENSGHQFLRERFPDEVCEPIRLHVMAKRYLITVDPRYREKLSPTSLKSFYDQGGTMSPSELEAFQANSFFEPALRLRMWDDEAKKTDVEGLCLEDFSAEIERVLMNH